MPNAVTPSAQEGLVALHELADPDRSHIQALVDLCKQLEPGLDLPLCLQPVPPASGGTNDFGYYLSGALVGLADLTPDDKPEVQCIVHPTHRRGGIGRALLMAVQQECRRRGAQGFTLVCEAAALSGLAFARAIGAAYRFSEHRMELDQARYVRREPVHEDLVVEPADMRDLEALVSIGPVLDDLTQDRVRQATVRWLEQPNRQYYLGGLRGEPVGMLRAGTYPPQVFIESFIVAPQQRGRGIGRQVLAAVIDRLIAENWAHILLEVATDNDVALSLYRSCGFVEVATYRYYWVPCTLKLGPSIHRRDGIDWP